MPESIVGRLERDGDIDTLILGSPPLIAVDLTLRGDTVAIVDPSAPTPSVRLVVSDQVAATPAVQAILGESALDALWGDDPNARFEVIPSAGLAALQRLALLAWLRWDSPRNLDPVLLELERATTLWELALALDDDGAREAEILGSQRQAHRLIVQAEIVALLDRPTNKLLRPIVVDLVDGFLRENAGDPGQQIVLRRQRDTIRGAQQLSDGVAFEAEHLLLLASALEQQHAPANRTAELAEFAGIVDIDEGGGPGENAGFVDSAQIPRLLHGILDTTADAVHWTFQPDGSVAVTVDRHPEGPINDLPKPFVARLTDGNGGVLASAPLVEREDGEVFVADLRPTGDLGDPHELRVDIGTDQSPPPAHGPVLSRHRAHHRAGWAFALQRQHRLLEILAEDTGSPAPEADPTIALSWDTAAGDFFDAGQDELAELVERRQEDLRSAPLAAGLGPTLAEVVYLADAAESAPATVHGPARPAPGVVHLSDHVAVSVDLLARADRRVAITGDLRPDEAALHDRLNAAAPSTMMLVHSLAGAQFRAAALPGSIWSLDVVANAHRLATALEVVRDVRQAQGLWHTIDQHAGRAVDALAGLPDEAFELNPLGIERLLVGADADAPGILAVLADVAPRSADRLFAVTDRIRAAREREATFSEAAAGHEFKEPTHLGAADLVSGEVVMRGLASEGAVVDTGSPAAGRRTASVLLSPALHEVLAAMTDANPGVAADHWQRFVEIHYLARVIGGVGPDLRQAPALFLLGIDDADQVISCTRWTAIDGAGRANWETTVAESGVRFEIACQPVAPASIRSFVGEILCSAVLVPVHAEMQLLDAAASTSGDDADDRRTLAAALAGSTDPNGGRGPELPGELRSPVAGGLLAELRRSRAGLARAMVDALGRAGGRGGFRIAAPDAREQRLERAGSWARLVAQIDIVIGGNR